MELHLHSAYMSSWCVCVCVCVCADSLSVLVFIFWTLTDRKSKGTGGQGATLGACMMKMWTVAPVRTSQDGGGWQGCCEHSGPAVVIRRARNFLRVKRVLASPELFCMDSVCYNCKNTRRDYGPMPFSVDKRSEPPPDNCWRCCYQIS